MKQKKVYNLTFLTRKGIEFTVESVTRLPSVTTLREVEALIKDGIDTVIIRRKKNEKDNNQQS